MTDTVRAPTDASPKLPPWVDLRVVGLVLLTLFVAVFSYRFAGLQPPPSALEAKPLEGTPGSIRIYGSLPGLFEGETEAKVSLKDVPPRPGIVGLGSLSDLRGEIAIVRGVTWLSYPGLGNSMTVESNPLKPESAGFLALAEVQRWQSDTLETAVPFDQLAGVIEERARRAGIDPNRPFPLLIEGTFSAIELNVVNGPGLGSEKPTQERLRDTAVKVSRERGEGSIVGFAGGGGEGLIHSGQRFHLHVVLPVAQEVGHLDSVRVEAGSLLRLPAMENELARN
jgi:alpha-acetolactate decarboxylase